MYTKKPTGGMSCGRPDHPRCHIAAWICMRGHTDDTSQAFKFCVDVKAEAALFRAGI